MRCGVVCHCTAESRECDAAHARGCGARHAAPSRNGASRARSLGLSHQPALHFSAKRGSGRRRGPPTRARLSRARELPAGRQPARVRRTRLRPPSVPPCASRSSGSPRHVAAAACRRAPQRARRTHADGASWCAMSGLQKVRKAASQHPDASVSRSRAARRRRTTTTPPAAHRTAFRGEHAPVRRPVHRLASKPAASTFTFAACACQRRACSASRRLVPGRAHGSAGPRGRRVAGR